jgi:hypothetical protein
LGIFPAQTVTAGKTNPLYLKLLNMQPYPVKLWAGTVIGELHSYDRVFTIYDPQRPKTYAKPEDNVPTDDWLLNSELPPMPEHIKSLDIGEPDITQEESNIIYRVLIKYADVCAKNDEEVGYCDIAPQTIDCPWEPFRITPYHISPAMIPKVTEELHDWERNGTARRSQSPYCSPVVIIPKKNGKVRICQDYRRLNAKCSRSSYSLPKMSDLLASAGKAKMFTSIDLQRGFHQIALA